MICTCPDCKYIFKASVVPERCPDCGKQAVRPSDDAETSWYTAREHEKDEYRRMLRNVRTLPFRFAFI